MNKKLFFLAIFEKRRKPGSYIILQKQNFLNNCELSVAAVSCINYLFMLYLYLSVIM